MDFIFLGGSIIWRFEVEAGEKHFDAFPTVPQAPSPKTLDSREGDRGEKRDSSSSSSLHPVIHKLLSFLLIAWFCLVFLRFSLLTVIDFDVFFS